MAVTTAVIRSSADARLFRLCPTFDVESVSIRVEAARVRVRKWDAQIQFLKLKNI